MLTCLMLLTVVQADSFSQPWWYNETQLIELQQKVDECFRHLGITGNGTQEEIEDELKVAMPKKKKEYHPDVCSYPRPIPL